MSKPSAVLLVVAVACVVGVTAGAAPAAAALATRSAVTAEAGAYGPAHGYRVGIAVYDTARGTVYGSGADTASFASESVVKVMIANRLLVQGRMHGTTATRAYKMITQSDDAIATSFYGSVGGDGLIAWIKQRYRVADLGTRPTRAGWWGNTHITPRGLVRYYARMKRDPKVGPWLLNAMHHATRYGSDGTYQFFGLPSATSGAAIKQGWGDDYDDGSRSADFNTTGFVNGNRYAVAILARGPIRDYGSAIGDMLTRTAKLLLPGGRFPDPVPTVRSFTPTTGRLAGGQRIAIHGTDFTSVTGVSFGGVPGTAVRVFRPTYLHVTTPAHAVGRVIVRVLTSHGTSLAIALRFGYLAPPAVTSVTPGSGPSAGGTAVTVTGAGFGGATAVTFGGTAGADLHVISSTTLTVIAPPGATGTVDVRVVTPYGTSTAVPSDAFTYTG